MTLVVVSNCSAMATPAPISAATSTVNTVEGDTADGGEYGYRGPEQLHLGAFPQQRRRSSTHTK